MRQLRSSGVVGRTSAPRARSGSSASRARPARSLPPTLRAADVTALQRAAGNQATTAAVQAGRARKAGKAGKTRPRRRPEPQIEPEEQPARGLPVVQRNPGDPPTAGLVLGGGPGTTDTVKLYHYGDLEGRTTFTSKPGYPRLTDYDMGVTQAEAAAATGAPVSPNLRYKYELVIDNTYFEKTFRNTGTRKGYSEYGTAQTIDVKYFRRVATLIVAAPTGGQAPPTTGSPPAGGGTLPPVPSGGSTAGASGAGRPASKWGMSPAFSAQLFGRTVDLALMGIKTWALLNLAKENEEKSATDRKNIQTLIDWQLDQQSDKVVDWWASYEPGVYLTVTTQTMYDVIAWVNMSNGPEEVTRYTSAWLLGAKLGTSLGDTGERTMVLGSNTKDNAVTTTLLVTDTTSVLVPVDDELLRERLEARIERIDAQLATMSELDRLELRLERDRLAARLRLIAP